MELIKNLEDDYQYLMGELKAFLEERNNALNSICKYLNTKQFGYDKTYKNLSKINQIAIDMKFSKLSKRKQFEVIKIYESFFNPSTLERMENILIKYSPTIVKPDGVYVDGIVTNHTIRFHINSDDEIKQIKQNYSSRITYEFVTTYDIDIYLELFKKNIEFVKSLFDKNILIKEQ